ncbi:MAG: hypothetical protein WAS27_02125 [Candidatus Saccharimonadales bacterium]
MKQILFKTILALTVALVLTAPSLALAAKCGGTETEFISCGDDAGLGAIGTIIKGAIIGVTALIGVVAVGGLAYAAVLYSSARDNKAQVEQAITIIRNVVIGLVLYGFSVAIVNWLVPGGIIG